LWQFNLEGALADSQNLAIADYDSAIIGDEMKVTCSPKMREGGNSPRRDYLRLALTSSGSCIKAVSNWSCASLVFPNLASTNWRL
jgi:hypothetical protein